MRIFDFRGALGALSIVFVGCSSSEHLLGETAGGAAGSSGNGDSAGGRNNAGDSGVAGGSSGASTGGASTGGSSTGGASTGGSSTGGSGNAGSGGASNVAGSSGMGGAGLESSCTQSGGTVMTALCCGLTSTGDFPPNCAIGGCGCAPSASHEVKICSCPNGLCFDGHACVASGMQ